MTPEQREARRSSLGASEIAAVAGIDPFRGAWDVWAEKMGLDIAEPVAGSDMGHLFERPLLEYYSRQTGIALTYPQTMRNPLETWMSATPDGLADDRVVQVKVVGKDMAFKWDNGVPEYVVCQVQWEMIVTRRPLATVVACVGGTDYRARDVPADRELQKTLYAIGRDFWFDHVLSGVPPDPDASEECRKTIAARSRKHLAERIPASQELIALAYQYKQLGTSITSLQEEREAIGNTLRLAIGERSGFEWESGRCTWKPDKNGNRTLLVNLRGERK